MGLWLREEGGVGSGDAVWGCDGLHMSVPLHLIWFHLTSMAGA